MGLWFLVLRHDIPSSVTTIGGCAFEACTLLKRGQSSIEPSSIGKGGRQSDIIVFLRSAPDIPIIRHRCRVKPHIRFMFSLEQCPITCVGRAGGGGGQCQEKQIKSKYFLGYMSPNSSSIFACLAVSVYMYCIFA